ncbi:MAG: response regulator [Alphaproteobacteria bacterium]|nr:response regulator [Alphaproteobacteria bacterium]
MQLHRKIKTDQFTTLFSRIKSEIAEWKVIDLQFDDIPDYRSTLTAAQKIESYFGANTIGNIFICSQRELLTLARVGQSRSDEDIKSGLAESILELPCSITTGDLTEQKLGSIKDRLNLAQDSVSNANIEFVFDKERKNRTENKFFIIDGSNVARKVLTHFLEGLGEVHVFENSGKVLQAYLEIVPDMVFTDINIPGGMSGFTLIKKIRSYDENAHVILQSAAATLENIKSAKDAGVRGFLGKPFTQERVLETIARCNTIDRK